MSHSQHWFNKLRCSHTVAQCEARGDTVQGGGTVSDEFTGAHSIMMVFKDFSNSEAKIDLQGVAEKCIGKPRVPFCCYDFKILYAAYVFVCIRQYI